MADLNTNPYAILTFIAAPAVLTNACTLLVLNTTNRLARVVDRTRIVVDKLETNGLPGWKTELFNSELTIHRRRATLLVRSLGLLYFSIGTFTAGVLLSLLGATLEYTQYLLAFRYVLIFSLLTGVAGLAALTVACVYLFAEIRLAILAIRHENEYVLQPPKVSAAPSSSSSPSP